MRNWFRNRYLDILGSIYIYNEHAGTPRSTICCRRCAGAGREERELIARIEKHRADERKHYVMFRRWFERRGMMPYALDAAFGHIDRFVAIMFGQGIDDLDKRRVVADDRLFGKLCRVISLTEKRGSSPGRDPAAPSAGCHRPVADQDVQDHRARRAEPLGAL